MGDHRPPAQDGIALVEERGRLLAHARFLRRIALESNKADTMGEALCSGINAICEYTGWPIGHGYVVVNQDDLEKTRLSSSGIWYRNPPGAFAEFKEVTEASSFRIGEGLPGDVWQSRAATSSSDIASDIRFDRNKAADEIKGCFAFPIIADDAVVAVLEFFACERISVDRYFLEAIEIAGNLLARAVERDRADSKLRASELRLRALTQTAADAIVTANMAGIIVAWNRACEAMFGYSAQEAQGQMLAIIMPEEYRALHQKGLDRYVRTRVPNVIGRTVELEAQRKDGSRFAVELAISTWESEGEPYFTGIIRDISQRKQHEAERAAEREQLRFLSSALQHASDAIMIYKVAPADDQPHSIAWVNDMFVQQTGYSFEEALGSSIKLLYGPKTDQSRTREFTDRLEKGEHVTAEILKYRKDGSTFWTEVHMRPVAGENGKIAFIVSIQRDITQRKKNAERILLLSEAIQNATDIILITSANRNDQGVPTIEYVNDAWVRYTGYSEGESLGQSISMLFGTDTAAQTVDTLRRTTQEGVPLSGQIRCYRKDGSAFWMEFSTKPIADAAGKITHWIGIGRDVSERVATQAWLELLSSAMEKANDMIVMFERTSSRSEWRICYANDMFVDFTGFSRDEIVGKTSQFLEGPETDVAALKKFRKELKEGKPIRSEVAYYHKDGSMFWAELNARPIAGPDNAITHTIVLYRDVTEKRLREAALSHEAAHDALTGMFNRRYFDQAMEAALSDARLHDATHGLLFLDLDGFKPVNDKHGHRAGDKFLQELAATLHARLRGADIFARLGGDEFAVLLQKCTLRHATKIAEHLMEAVQQFRLPWEDQALAVGVSIGVATIDREVAGVAEALRKADEACYEAKRGGRNRIAVAR